mmetsp:Transcript_114600/g.263028  ORF Transcript_114600/g.263028 Transcript_114600/m.263028 type:complete len:299 (-) Transcript_114600:6-902(-)
MAYRGPPSGGAFFGGQKRAAPPVIGPASKTLRPAAPSWAPKAKSAFAFPAPSKGAAKGGYGKGNTASLSSVHSKGGKGGFTPQAQHPPVIGRASSGKGGLDLSKMVPRTVAVKAKGKPAPVLHAKSAAKAVVHAVHAGKGAKSQAVIKQPVKLGAPGKGTAASKAAVNKALQDREKDASQAKARARAAVATLEQQVDTLAAEVAKAAPQAPVTWGKDEFIAASATAIKAIDSLRNKISGLTANIAGKLGNVTDAQGRATQAELSRLQNRMQQLRTALDGHTKSAKGMIEEVWQCGWFV